MAFITEPEPCSSRYTTTGTPFRRRMDELPAIDIHRLSALRDARHQRTARRPDLKRLRAAARKMPREGENTLSENVLPRPGRREQAATEPLISRAMLADVPLTGLSSRDGTCCTEQKIALYAIFCIVVAMQPLKQLSQSLRLLADREHCVFAGSDLAAAVPECGHLAGLLSRATKAGLLKRVCRGIYLYPVRDYPAGHLLFHAAARLRVGEFNYISLETVLSDAGVISQVPMNWISLMTSGRSHVVDCGDYGHIEFVHTAQRPDDVSAELTYDPDRRLWRASVRQALRDMKATRRSMDIIDEEAASELV
jgi:hypothetical protein